MKKILLLISITFFFSTNAVASRTINSITVSGSSSTTVSSGATISVSISVTTSGSGDNKKWKSTGWLIASSSSALNCNNHSNHNQEGTYIETLNITAPTSNATYNLYMVAYKDNSCSSGASREKILLNAVIVGTATQPPTVSSLKTIDTTPVLTGTFNSSNSAGDFTVTVNSITYTLASSSELTNRGDNWALDLSNVSKLSAGTYEVVARSNDGAGNILSDTTSNELIIISPVAYYAMDEASWNRTANKVVDSSGNNHSGTSFNGTATNQSTPALSGNPGTCGYGVFDGRNDYIEIPHHSSLNGSQALTYTAWINANQWSGTRQIMAKSVHGGGSGRAQMGIFYEAGKFKGRAETNNGRITIQTTAPSTNTWHHVALVYSATSLVLYVDGVAAISSTFSSSTLNSTNDAINISKRVGSSQYYFDGLIDEVRIYTLTLTQPDIQLIMNETHPCGGGSGGDTPAVNFNCVENGADGISGKLYTKTTAQSFSFDIVALQDASTIETNFSNGADHTVTVELVNAVTAATCSSYPALNPAVSQSLTFSATDSGSKASANMTSSTAYSTVKCRVTDATDNPSITGCSTDSFAIRPTALNISSSLTNTGSTGTPKAKAGENFTLTTTATAGYDGTPVINNTKLQAHSRANQVGSISGAFNAASSATGIATGTVFNYSEVGVIRFTAQGVYDDSFTSVDQSNDCTNDFSNSIVSGKVGCKFGNTSTTSYFGRFTPDHLDVTLNTPAFSPSCGTFTYISQPVKYAVSPIATVTAKNAAGETTQNYTGNFWKINPTDATYSITPSYSVANHSLFVLEASAPSYSDNGNGSGTLTFADTTSNILAVTKSALTPPFDAEIALNFTLSDTDAIVVANVDGSAQVNPVSFGTTSPGNGISFSNKTHRWGRVTLNNVYGSELTSLSVPLTTEYYDGTTFIKNTADNCTSFILSNDFSISDATDFNCTFATQTTPVIIGSGSVKASINNSTTSNGATEIIISDNLNIANGPGAGNTGYVDITSKLSNLSWLYYDWDANGTHDNCPSARVTFGIYKGNDRIIYFREDY